MVTTTRSGFAGLNPETQKVINYMTGKRTKKQIVGEFFGLKEEAVYDDEGENVIDYINNFKEQDVLEANGVHYNKALAKLGVTEEEFNSLFYGLKPNYGGNKQGVNDNISTNTEKIQTLSNSNKGVKDNTGTDGKTSVGGKPVKGNKGKASFKKK